MTRCVEYETVWMLRVRKMKVQMGGNVVIRLRVAAAWGVGFKMEMRGCGCQCREEMTLWENDRAGDSVRVKVYESG